MNAMVNRLEYAHPEAIKEIPETRYWEMIDAYMVVDEVLANLYKQYVQAKENLARLVIDNGSDDPMTEVAWDMHDSTRCAIETRLIELRKDSGTTERARKIKLHNDAKAQNSKILFERRKSPSDKLNEAMVFMMLAGMIMNANKPRQDIRQDFVRAS